MDINKFSKSIWVLLSKQVKTLIVLHTSRLELYNLSYKGTLLKRVEIKDKKIFINDSSSDSKDTELKKYCLSLLKRFFFSNPLGWITSPDALIIKSLKDNEVNEKKQVWFKSKLLSQLNINGQFNLGICIQNHDIAIQMFDLVKQHFSVISHSSSKNFVNIDTLKRSTDSSALTTSPSGQPNTHTDSQDRNVDYEYDFSELKTLCLNFIKEVDNNNKSVVINSNNTTLDYSYSTVIDKEKIKFNKRSSYENKELVLNFESNQLFVNKTPDNKSRNMFITYFNQIISDITANKAKIKGSDV